MGTPGGSTRRRLRRLEPFRLTSTRQLHIRPPGTNRLPCSPPMYLGRPLKRRRSRSSWWAARLPIRHITRCTRRLNCGGRTPPVTAIRRSQPDIRDGSRPLTRMCRSCRPSPRRRLSAIDHIADVEPSASQCPQWPMTCRQPNAIDCRSSAEAVGEVTKSVRRLQVTFLPFARRWPRMSGLTVSECVLPTQAVWKPDGITMRRVTPPPQRRV